MSPDELAEFDEAYRSFKEGPLEFGIGYVLVFMVNRDTAMSWAIGQ